MTRFINFAKKVINKTIANIKNFFIGAFRHAETTAILVLSAVGLNFMLSEVPFIIMLPAWVELPFFIPAASVLIISLLIKAAEVRHDIQTSNV